MKNHIILNFFITAVFSTIGCNGFESAMQMGTVRSASHPAPPRAPPPPPTPVGFWNYIEALGATVPAPQAADLPPAPAQVTIGWNPVAGTVTSYNVYRATQSGGQDYNFPLATGISVPLFTDSAVAAGTTYYYTIAAVVAGHAIPQNSAVDFEVSVAVPPDNMALVHPWMANWEACTLLGRPVEPANNYRCNYVGPGNTGGFLNMQKPLFVDAYGEGCNYTSMGLGALPPNTKGKDGDIYFDRSGSVCYAKVAGAWVSANNADANTLKHMISNAPGLPPVVQISQVQSWTACQSIGVSGFTQPKRLMTHREHLIAAAWSPGWSNSQVTQLENGSVAFACNTNNGKGLKFSPTAVPTDPETIPGQGPTNAIWTVRSGSFFTGSCVSRFGIQDMVGNVFNWNSDQMGTCNANSCVGATSTLDATNSDWNGLAFDGVTGPGGRITWAGTFASLALGESPFDSFQPVIGVPMLSTAAASWDYLKIGTANGQFDPTQFHSNNFALYTTNANGTPARGAIAGGDFAMMGGAGRFTLMVNFYPAFTDSFIGFRCALPSN